MHKDNCGACDSYGEMVYINFHSAAINMFRCFWRCLGCYENHFAEDTMLCVKCERAAVYCEDVNKTDMHGHGLGRQTATGWECGDCFKSP